MARLITLLFFLFTTYTSLWGQSARVVLDSIALKPATVQIKTCRKATDKFVDLGQFDAVDSLVQYALRLTTKNGKPAVLGNVYRSMGYLAKQRSEFQTALHHCQQAIALHRQAGNHGQVSNLLVMIGHVCERVNDEKNRGNYYRAGLAEAQRYKLVGAEADALSNMANYYDNARHRPQSLAYSEKALRLYQQINDDGDTMCCCSIERLR